MRSFRVSGRRVGRIATTAALLVATIVPSFAPALASAAQLTDRSVQLSSSNEGATAEYTFTFTATSTAAAVTVEFCSNTPLMPETCTAPSGMVVHTGGSVASGGTLLGTWTANKAFITKSVTAGSNTFTLAGIVNPSAEGTIYARIVTYDNTTNAQAYASGNLGSGVQDQGAAAIAITNGIDVSGAVLESLTFCTSGAALTDSDTDNNWCESATTPTLTLGHDVGSGVIALDTSALDTANVYTQLSTNASKGAVVRIKSNAICGGLIRDGDSSQVNNAACTGIAAAGNSGTFAPGTAKFGVKVAIADLGASPSTDKLQLASGYDATDYRLNWVSGNASGVSSTYGDEIMNTNLKPVTDQGATLTFGASVGNGTPAGKYRATLSLIATGTF